MGRILCPRVRFWDRLAANLGRPRAVLGASWASQGRSGGALGVQSGLGAAPKHPQIPPGRPFRSIEKPFDFLVFLRSGAVWARPRSFWGPPWAPKMAQDGPRLVPGGLLGGS